MVSAFEGNKAEIKIMLPVIEKFMAAHRLPDVTMVVGAGMISDANQTSIDAAGLSLILGMKIPDVPYQLDRWRREHLGEDIPDGHVFTQPWPAGPSSKRRDQVNYYQFRGDRARRTLSAIDEQVAKAAKAVTRFIENRTGWSIRSSSAPPAATRPSRSTPASTPSPPKTRSRLTSAKSSPSSSNPAAL
jgi:hypothetical protein